VGLSKLEEQLLKQLAWRELALRFLDSMNPKPDKAIVIADAICAYRNIDYLGGSTRHHAHFFVREAIRQIEQEMSPTVPSTTTYEWIYNWNKAYGAKA
jgi:hypothetical protein